MKINLNTVKKTERAGFFFNMKMLMPSIFFIIFIFVLLYACGGSNNSSDPNPAAPANTEEPANDNPDNDNPDNDDPVNYDPIRFNNPRWGSLYYYCALLIDQTLGCWSDPTVITKRSDQQFIQTSSFNGGSNTCAIDTSNILYCATGTTGELATVSTDQKFNYVELGKAYRCALSTSNKLYCWGDNDNGQLGTGDTETQNTPTPVSNDHDFVYFALSSSDSEFNTCAITKDGTAYCWGQNDVGQLGTGDRDPVLVPTRVDTDIKFRQIVLVSDATCGLSLDYKLFCWGDKGNDSLFPPSNTPVEVPTGDLKFNKISGNYSLLCGLIEEGSIFCANYIGFDTLTDDDFRYYDGVFSYHNLAFVVTNQEGEKWLKVKTDFKFVQFNIDNTLGCNMAFTSDNELYCSGQTDPSSTTSLSEPDKSIFHPASAGGDNIKVILPR